MQYLHVKNIEKYHPGYKDRKLSWCKFYFTCINSDPDFHVLHEVDKWRFFVFIALELQNQRPIPLSHRWLYSKGFDFRTRPLSLTINMLQPFTEVRNEEGTDTEPLQDSNLEKRREDKDKSKIQCVTKPSLKEVQDYCLERNNAVDPEAFYSYYEANGWVQGRGQKPIKNWKACVITWEKNDFGRKGGKLDDVPESLRHLFRAK